MLQNYFKIALRNLRRQPGFSAISILGLAIGLSIGLLVIVYVRSMTGYDAFHDKSDRIYRVYSDFKSRFNSFNNLYGSTPATLGPVLQAEYPEVEDVVRMRAGFRERVLHEGEGLQLSGIYADPGFFRVFSFELAAGDPATALSAPYSVVISRETATRFFGETDPLGQSLTTEKHRAYTVTGVLQDKPYKTHLPLDAIASFATLASMPAERETMENWRRSIYTYHTYVLLKEEASPAELEARFPSVIARYFPGDAQDRIHDFHMQALPDIYLGKQMGNQLGRTGSMFSLYLLSALAAVILLIACFNYMNLSVARSLRRAKEVGIRKVVGAQRSQIIAQLLTESVLVALFALGIALALLEGLLPFFNTYSPVHVEAEGGLGIYLIFLAFGVLVGVVSGLYPALYLSAFLPVRVLKGAARTRRFSGVTASNVLIALQFACSLIFIITAITLYRQSAYVLKADYGFDQEHLINVALQEADYSVFRGEMMKHSGVANISAVSILPASGSRSDTWIKTGEMIDPVKGYTLYIDEYFIDNMGLTLLTGRNFSPELSTDSTAAVILNETALRALGLGAPRDAVGQTVLLDDDEQAEVIGVVRDYHYDDIARPIYPLILAYRSDQLNFANLRLQPGDHAGVIAALEATWKKVAPLHPVLWEFMDEQIRQRLVDYSRNATLIGAVAALAILIACLGLLGMASYSTEIRTKEVGIRKALGAGVATITVLLSRAFVNILFVATLLATPAAWFLNDALLQPFAYRIALSPWIFLAGILAMVVLAGTAVASQAVKAALANPVDVLRYE